MNDVSIRKVISDITETQESLLSADTTLESLGWDSLCVLSFMAKCESAFDVILDSEALSRSITIGDLVRVAMESNTD
jgi:acyl carrier protein